MKPPVFKTDGQSVDKPRISFFCGVLPHFVFSATGASKKLLVSENPLNKRIFKGAGVVLAELNKRLPPVAG